jgi:hypothetical protein
VEVKIKINTNIVEGKTRGRNKGGIKGGKKK